MAALNRVLGDENSAGRYEGMAVRIRGNLTERFWMQDHFAEYRSLEHGLIDRHGLSDADWAAVAFGVATREQESVLWPRLRDEKRFYYGGMPTGIVTEPEKYEAWEFSYPDSMDLAAMGRVWYLECQARARMGDAAGLVESIRRVARVGRESGYYWRERYTAKGGKGAQKYCEYPANLIRVVQRFLLGVDLRLDGSVFLSPTVTPEFWKHGFGHRLVWQNRVLDFRMRAGKVTGTYTGGELMLGVRGAESARVNGRKVRMEMGLVTFPASCRFEIRV